MIFDIFKQKKFINIDSTKIINGNLLFFDYSLDRDFFIKLDRINGEIVNFPSTVYPDGKIILNGRIDNRKSCWRS